MVTLHINGILIVQSFIISRNQLAGGGGGSFFRAQKTQASKVRLQIHK